MQKDSVYSLPAMSVIREGGSRAISAPTWLWSVQIHMVQRLKCQYGTVVFIFFQFWGRGGSCTPDAEFTVVPLGLWMKPVVMESPPKSYWHIILSSTSPLRLFSFHVSTLHSDRKLYYCVQCVCPVAALPSFLTLAVEPGAFPGF